MKTSGRPKLVLVLLIIAAGGVGLACDSTSAPESPAGLEVLSALPALAPVGSEITVSFRVVDQVGKPIPGINALWSAVGGEFSRMDPTTDDDGVVSADVVLTLPPGSWIVGETSVALETDADRVLRKETAGSVAPIWFEPVLVGEGTPAELTDAGCVAFTAETAGGERAARWMAGELQILDSSPSRALGANDAGAVTGYLSEGIDVNHAVVWSDGSRLDLPSDSFGWGQAADIDAAGTVYGHVRRSTNPHYQYPALWRHDGRLVLPFGNDPPGGLVTDATDSGVYGGLLIGDYRGFVVQEADTLSLDWQVLGVNESGAAAGRRVNYNTGSSPWRYTESRGQEALEKRSFNSEAKAISSDGVAVGGAVGRSPHLGDRSFALLWPPTNSDALELEAYLSEEGWRVHDAVSINSDNWILVSGSHPDHGEQLVVLLKPLVWPN